MTKSNKTSRPPGVQHCPCGSGNTLDTCCQPYLNNEDTAPTAEALMRSRYTAYTQENEVYLLATWHPDTRPKQLSFDPAQRWLGLKIKQTTAGQPSDTHGTMEFVARSKRHGKATRLHEISQFKKHGDSWYYLESEHIAERTKR